MNSFARLLWILLLVAAPAWGLTSGLDERPGNASCVAFDRPPTGASVALRTVASVDVDGSLRPPLAMAQAPGDASRWFVLFRGGVVVEYADGETFSKVGTVLDLSDRVVTTFGGLPAEFGALGIAFHPEFAANHKVFVYYTTAGEGDFARLSEFSSADGGSTLDPDSERVLLEIELTSGVHVGGMLEFGPDGYLYLAVGEGGNRANAQDPYSLQGKILRLDVDSGVPYGIPADNPWASGGGRGEVYALGLRNPWRGGFDRDTGDLWVGDVGQSEWEEIDVIVKGGNYGWPIKEGSQCFLAATCDSTGLIDPIVEYPHESGSAAVAGGYVYRGEDIPNLQGVYLYLDLIDGRLSALFFDEQGQPAPEVILETGGGYNAFAQGQDGELYLLRYGKLDRLVPAGPPEPSDFPQRLSETGCVRPDDPAIAAPGVIPYDVNVSLWSDGASKERWMAVPDGTTIDILADGDFAYPVGTVLIKTFRVEDQLIETRLFMRHADGEWGGYSYEWNAEQTDAFLLPSSRTKALDNGQVWHFPSRGECLSCHTAVAGRALGPEIVQLNGDLLYPGTGRIANQLSTLDAIGLFTGGLPAAPASLPALPGIGDEARSVDGRARAYLHANCSMCHRPGGPGLGPEDFRYGTAGLDMGLYDVAPTQSDFGIEGARLYAPGSPDRSILFHRLRTLGLGRMPPLATSVVDTSGIGLIDRWIRSGLGFGVGDTDGDEVADNIDNCPLVANELQGDFDEDGSGDACDGDRDDDGYANEADAFPFDPSEWSDLDGDGIGDNGDPDRDGDGIANDEDPDPDDPSNGATVQVPMPLWGLLATAVLLTAMGLAGLLRRARTR